MTTPVKALYIDYNNAGTLKLVDISDQEAESVRTILASIHSGEADLVVVEKDATGGTLMRQALVESEEVPVDSEDENDEDTVTVYSIADWTLIS